VLFYVPFKVLSLGYVLIVSYKVTKNAFAGLGGMAHVARPNTKPIMNLVHIWARLTCPM